MMTGHSGLISWPDRRIVTRNDKKEGLGWEKGMFMLVQMKENK